MTIHGQRIQRSDRLLPMTLLRSLSFLLALMMGRCLLPVAVSASTPEPHRPAGETEEGPLDDLQIGFEGVYKVGCWVPIRVASRQRLEQVRVSLPDGEGIPCEYPLTRHEADGAFVYQGHVRFGQWRSTLAVRYGDGLVQMFRLDPENRMLSTQRLVLVLGSDVGITDALRTRSFAEETSVRTVAISRLAPRWYSYDAVDLIVVTTGETMPDSGQSQIARHAADLPALLQWVRNGGRLILTVGRNARQLIAPGQPLEAFLPGTFQRVQRQVSTIELETFTGSRKRLDLLWQNLPQAEKGIPVVRMENPRGRVIVAEGIGESAVPWALRTATGFGSITLVTCDLDTGPLLEWKGRTRLVAALLDASLMRQPTNDRDAERKGQVSHIGFNDLAGQLRTAMEQYRDVTLIPFSLIAAIAIGYVLLIGPADYFFLARFAPRMEWTWLSFSVLLVGVIGLGSWMMTRWNAPTPRRNVVDLLDVDASSGETRCSSWAHFYYPTGGMHDFSIRPGSDFAAAEGTLLAWEGLPGSGLGGMQNRAPAASYLDPYQCEVASVSNMAFPEASSRGLTATWWQTSSVGESDLKVSREELLTGSFQNPLPVTLRDAVLCYGRNHYEVGDVAGNATILIAELGHPRDFRYRLSRRKIVDTREVVEPWSKENLNIPRIVELMMFHDKAGGYNYTGLWNRYYQRLDFSDHLETGAAVLYGRLARPATRWDDAPCSGPPKTAASATDSSAADGHGDTRNWTFCRIVYPVKVNALSRYRPQENMQP